MDDELLANGVVLPRKHCFWVGCGWTGETNDERAAHVKANHWSDRFQECVGFYNPQLPENVRIETVLNEIARVKLAEHPPRTSPAQDRRGLRGLQEALQPEE